MAEPDWKHPEVDAMLKEVTGRDRPAAIRANICALCGGPAAEFADALSRREYAISGMCQRCQDIGFAPPEDEL